jgi:undecaprenyl-diphosphatase
MAAAQSGEINWLKNNHSANPPGYWKHVDETVYPVALGAPLATLVTGYIKKDKNIQAKGWHLATTLVVNTAITQSMKYAINRQRPYEKYPTIIFPYDNSEKGKSFPSGHTSTAFSTATALSMDFKKWYVVVPAYAWAGSVGYARLKKGEHYPTDVLAGAAVGAGSALLSQWLNRKLFPIK